MLNIEHLPRVRLAHLPTPLERAERLGAALGIELWIKRDDCTGLALGGNKTRKLEFTFGQALKDAADVVIANGGYQSNHVRQTVAAAAKLGLESHVVVADPAPGRGEHYRRSGNLLLDHLTGAHIHVAADSGTATDAKIKALAAELTAAGRKPFVVPLGASDAVGSVGYALCAAELLEQCRAAGIDPRWAVLATGSAGTHAGLLTGLRVMGAATQVLGFSSSEPAEIKHGKVRAIVDPLLRRLKSDARVTDVEIEVSDAHVGGGYGVPTEGANAAIAEAASLEGLILDPVYTGKAMAGLIEQARAGRFRSGEPVIFLHTGGTPALFVYDDAFWAGLPD